MISAMEVRLDQDFLDTAVLSGFVHSVFRRTINLSFPGYLITLALPDTAGLPDSVVLPYELFSSVADFLPGTPIVKKQNTFFIEGRQSFELPSAAFTEIQTIPRCVVSPHLLFKSIVSFLGSSGFTSMLEWQRLEIFQRLSSFCRQPSETALINCVGWGCGLTPSSDDALVGILAAADAGVLPKILLNSRQLWDVLKSYTTDVSRKYLCCAAKGQFSSPLVNFFGQNSLGSLEIAAGKIAAVGASSGCDTLTGIALACWIGRQKGRYE